MGSMNHARSFWLTHALAPALLCAGLAAAIHFGGWDWWLAGSLHSAGEGWPLDNALGRALHRGERGIIGAVALAALLGLAHPRWRRPASYLLLCLVLTASLASLGKHLSGVQCPKDLAQFGAPARAEGRGQCFPAGHSSAAFALVSLYFLLGTRRPRWRWAGLAAGGALGLVFAATQWARGMHVPSHDLASAALAWAVAVAAYTAVYRRRLWDARHAPAAD